MKHDYNYHAQWTNGISHQHEINLDLNLFVEDFLTQHPNIREELLHNEAGLRKELMNVITQKLVRQIVDESGLSADIEGTLNTKSKKSVDNDMQVGIPRQKGLTHFIRNRIRMLLKIETDRPVNAMQAFYAERGSTASEIADNIINALKKRFLGIDVHEYETDSSLIGDEVTEVRHRINRSTSRN